MAAAGEPFGVFDDGAEGYQSGLLTADQLTMLARRSGTLRSSATPTTRSATAAPGRKRSE